MIYQSIFCFFFISIISSILADTGNDLELKILHTNDMHSRFDEFLTLSSECSAENKKQKKCFGGFARLATILRSERSADPSVLFLNGGDNYQGTPWFNVYKSKIVTDFMNILKPSVATLGNHEFDLGTQGLVPYLKGAEFPIVVCNVDFSNDENLKTINIKKSITLDVKGRKVGIIGYLTQETKNTSQAGNVTFFDDIECIKQEVKKLQNEGVNILIGLGHSGYTLDQKIAREVEGIDLVVGGHSHTFLYSGNRPKDIEEPFGPYPTKVTQKSGKTVYVVQAYAYTKYLGNLQITFDAQGEIKKFDSYLTLMNHEIPQAEDVLKKLEKLRPKVEEFSKQVIGYTRVLLHHTLECRTKECNLGNLITDAMIEDNIKKIKPNNKGWTDAAVAIMGTGAAKASIENLPDEVITMADIKHILPYENPIFKIQISGKKLLSVLEVSVSALQYNVINKDPSGKFLHYSGLQVFYDLSQPIGSRVVVDLLLIRCADCLEPQLEKFNIEKNYTILINEFIATGGDGYEMLKGTQPLSIGVTQEECLANYIKQRGIVFPSVEGRIQYIDPDQNIPVDLDVETFIQLVNDN